MQEHIKITRNLAIVNIQISDLFHATKSLDYAEVLNHIAEIGNILSSIESKPASEDATPEPDPEPTEVAPEPDANTENETTVEPETE